LKHDNQQFSGLEMTSETSCGWEKVTYSCQGGN